MPTTHDAGPPMSLGNMRHHGVRSLSITCELCRHAAVVNVDGFADTVTVPSFRSRMVCTSCGIIGADVRPNWSERAVGESLTGRQWRH
jgi:hypothetical protein